MDRRTFLRAMFIGGGAALLAACGAAPATPGDPAATSAPTAPAGPKQGGVYRTVTAEPFGTLDSARAFGWVDWWLSYNVIHSTLYRFDASGNILAELADGMPTVSDDQLTYTVKLKPGVKFHNGREMTASDVKFSFDRNMWKETESAGMSYLDNIAGYGEAEAGTVRELSGVKVVDPSTVSFTLSQPQSTFVAVLGITTFGIIPEAETLAAGQDWGTKVLIGTGPFKIKEWKLGERLTLERHSEYFKPGLPYLDGIDVTLNVKAENAILQWEAGDVDFLNAEAFPAAELPRIRADERMKGLIKETPSSIFNRFAIANNTKPFDDVRVRQAIAMAIDKQNLATRSQAGEPLDTLYSGTPQAIPGFASNWQYNPDQAKALLAEANFPTDATYQMISTAVSQELSESIQADLKAVGINTELIVLFGSGVSFDVYRERVDSGEIPLQLRGFGPDYPDAASIVNILMLCGAEPPPSRPCNSQVAELASQANLLPIADPKRTELLRQIENIVINEDVYHFPLYTRNALVLSHSRVRGDEPDPFAAFPIPEKIWIDA
jgi:ABC-type transport system substrate-binding protein